MIQGSASIEKTQALRSQFPIPYRNLGGTGLSVSEVGFGTQYVENAEAHFKAMEKALQGGVNLIDTCGFYGNGAAEVLVGRVLSSLIDGGRNREEFFVVSKAGFVNLEHGQTATETMTALNPNLAYCLDPAFIAAQIGASLERMGLEKVDCFMLHNPETLLQYHAQKRTDREEARTAVLAQIRAAFEQLEQEVAKGRIASYGISCNTLRSESQDYDALSLVEMRGIATDVAEDHHFRIIELPLNLLETEAVTTKNHPNERDVISYARDVGMGILVNRVMEGQTGKQWLRFVDLAPQGDAPASMETLLENLDELADLEEDVLYKALPLYELSEERQRELKQHFFTAAVLEQTWTSFMSSRQWETSRDYFATRTGEGMAQLKAEAERSEATAMLDAYWAKLNAVLDQFSAYFQNQSARDLGQIKEALLSLRPQWERQTRMSRLALRAVREEAGISCILLGMRREAYVEEAFSEIQTPTRNDANPGLLRQLNLKRGVVV